MAVRVNRRLRIPRYGSFCSIPKYGCSEYPFRLSVDIRRPMRAELFIYHRKFRVGTTGPSDRPHPHPARIAPSLRRTPPPAAEPAKLQKHSHTHAHLSTESRATDAGFDARRRRP